MIRALYRRLTGRRYAVVLVLPPDLEHDFPAVRAPMRTGLTLTEAAAQVDDVAAGIVDWVEGAWLEVGTVDRFGFVNAAADG